MATSLSGPLRALLRGLALAFLTAMLIGCEDPVLPLPPTAQQFTPGPVYREWWSQVEGCSGRTGAFDAVRWYVVPGDEPFRVATIRQPVLGYWDSLANRIVLLEWVPSATELVRHEILHALLKRTDHPAEYFERRCGALISGPGVVGDG
jgi:hypothetical protein